MPLDLLAVFDDEAGRRQRKVTCTVARTVTVARAGTASRWQASSRAPAPGIPAAGGYGSCRLQPGRRWRKSPCGPRPRGASRSSSATLRAAADDQVLLEEDVEGNVTGRHVVEVVAIKVSGSGSALDRGRTAWLAFLELVRLEVLADLRSRPARAARVGAAAGGAGRRVRTKCSDRQLVSSCDASFAGNGPAVRRCGTVPVRQEAHRWRLVNFSLEQAVAAAQKGARRCRTSN